MEERRPESSSSESGAVPEPGLETLAAAACLDLLQRGGVGRIGLRGAEAPLLRPVNFLLRGSESLVVRTGDGAILRAARLGEPAAFEIDGIDPMEHTGWSVIAQGRLRELPSDAANLALPLRPWASGHKERFIALSLDKLSGLRIPSGRGNR